MKTYTFTIDGKNLTLRFDEHCGHIVETNVDGESPTVSPDDMSAYAAAISLALLESDVEVVHDEEPDVITLATAKSRWANPAEAMNERGSLLKPLLGW